MAVNLKKVLDKINREYMSIEPQKDMEEGMEEPDINLKKENEQNLVLGSLVSIRLYQWVMALEELEDSYDFAVSSLSIKF